MDHLAYTGRSPTNDLTAYVPGPGKVLVGLKSLPRVSFPITQFGPLVLLLTKNWSCSPYLPGPGENELSLVSLLLDPIFQLANMVSVWLWLVL